MDVIRFRNEREVADHVATEIERLVASNPRAVLGIGRNGHVAFNEPGAPHDSVTRPIELTDSTRRTNATAFGTIDAVPSHALTQGIGTILHAEQILLLATGEAKAEAVAAAVDGPITDQVPASALQRHPRAAVVVDTGAATALWKLSV